MRLEGDRYYANKTQAMQKAAAGAMIVCVGDLVTHIPRLSPCRNDQPTTYSRCDVSFGSHVYMFIGDSLAGCAG